MMNGWKIVAVLAALAGGGAQAAQSRDTVAGRCTANVDRETGKIFLVGYLDGGERSGTAPRDGNDSHEADRSRTRERSEQDDYSPASEPSFPGME